MAEADDIVSFGYSTKGVLWGLTVKSVTLPCLLLAALNAKNLWDEHWEHEKHRPPLEERVQYSYQNIRTKAFPWGDGDKVSHSSEVSMYLNFTKLSVDSIVSGPSLFFVVRFKYQSVGWPVCRSTVGRREERERERECVCVCV